MIAEVVVIRESLLSHLGSNFSHGDSWVERTLLSPLPYKGDGEIWVLFSILRGRSIPQNQDQQ